MVLADITIAVDSCDPTTGLIPGQVISGRVICRNAKPKDFEHITLTFSGAAQVHWTEIRKREYGNGEYHHAEEHKVYFTSRENYFEYSTILASGGTGNNVLPAGRNSFPFQFTFPDNIPLPSSFEGPVAQVRYQLLARVKRRLFKSDSKAIQLFSYYAPLDLNALAEGDTRLISGPQEQHAEKCVGCLCCRSGQISCKIDIAKQGFVPGEYLSFKGQFVNNSKSEIKYVVVQLHAIARYHAEGHSRRDSLIVASTKSEPIEPGKTFCWDGSEVLEVPPWPPTNLGGHSQIISLEYSLEFSMVTRACSKNLSVAFPIVIGTVPLAAAA